MTDLMNTEQILPCPFCGGEAHTWKRGGEMNWVAGCEKAWPECPVAPFTHAHDTEAEAITAWNTRPQTPSLPNIGQAIEAVYEHAFGPTPNTSGNWNDAIEAAAKVAETWQSSLKPGNQNRELGHLEARRNIADAIRALSRQDGMVRKGEQGDD